jgi:hypothetical protein
MLPKGLSELDDVAVARLHDGLTVHRPGDIATTCGCPMWSMLHPAPSAGHVVNLHPQWCTTCFEPLSGWAELLALAYPSRLPTADIQDRRQFTHINGRLSPRTAR